MHLGADTDVEEGEEPPEVVVMASGCLGLISFPREPGRLSVERISELYPALMGSLREHPGIGFLLVSSEAHGALAIGANGTNFLEEDRVEGEDPLEPFGPRAARHVLRTHGFEHCPDIVVNSTYWTVQDEVAAFEELVGSHGGMGGTQSHPFLLHPRELELDGEELVGARRGPPPSAAVAHLPRPRGIRRPCAQAQAAEAGIRPRRLLGQLGLALRVQISVGEDLVEVPAGGAEHLTRTGHLGLTAGLHDLGEREADLADQPPELLGLAGGTVAAELLPGRGPVGRALIDELAAGVGERVVLAPVLLLGADQPLVLELREGRVDRAGARAPEAAAALLDLLHDLVAVAGLLRQQQQRRGADVPPAGLAAPASGSTVSVAAEGRSAELAARPVGEAAAAVGVSPAPSGAGVCCWTR